MRAPEWGLPDADVFDEYPCAPNESHENLFYPNQLELNLTLP
jgi:hypothetical protein